ncbi:biotin--[acetyl-CoA-carboxylase] ligase [Maribacter hydrothermalis]|uniref:Biotin--[acetyl-CoA-carboxylase] ligase n=1 Tax=Maribacter hydrothermalis TaxID=1836467 RepID=A0A1B7ZBF1_9FLAO|nr:biotin--[acetyl-CoA-carboxylase] ligase [Maribacter hydrothermalis]APQ16464.1 biotin--[acetyl-CoA-carboxylase] ligase [Maribacter hydrothermalis]OBR40028.1 biotin--[acetyl-CoA-carboxylase] ligase [Maribacter hydrothermalis]
MQIIKLDATPSTNSYLKELSTQKVLKDFTIITTQNQTLGRGQLNAKWESDAGKNLAFSILKKEIDVSINKAFLISMSVSLAILEGLKELGVPDLKIKWPNDILSGNSKIGGILIENIISGSQIKRSIIGFGLNVNQKVFKNAPHAASLNTIVGRNYDLDKVFYLLIEKLHYQLQKPILAVESELFARYHSHLFKKGEACTFTTQDNSQLKGVIVGVTINGTLNLKLENGDFQEFGLKKIQLQY